MPGKNGKPMNGKSFENIRSFALNEWRAQWWMKMNLTAVVAIDIAAGWLWNFCFPLTFVNDLCTHVKHAIFLWMALFTGKIVEKKNGWLLKLSLFWSIFQAFVLNLSLRWTELLPKQNSSTQQNYFIIFFYYFTTNLIFGFFLLIFLA